MPGVVQSPGSLLSNNTVPLEGTQFHSVEQVLRFDVTKEWVYHNWSRKSTGPTDVGLFAVRVPVVTGTQLAAIAGSLTYFFNSYGQVEHISFRGRTGDPTQLVNFLMRTYGFQRSTAPVGEQLLQVKRGERIQSELRTRSESVVSHSFAAQQLCGGIGISAAGIGAIPAAARAAIGNPAGGVDAGAGDTDRRGQRGEQ